MTAVIHSFSAKVSNAEDLSTARAYGRWLDAQDKTNWPPELLRVMAWALYARQHQERPATEQSDFTRQLDAKQIAEADAAYALFASQGA